MKRKKMSDFEALVLAIIVLFVFSTSVVGNVAILTNIISNIFTTKYYDNATDTLLLQTCFSDYCSTKVVTRTTKVSNEDIFTLINKKMYDETKQIFNVSGVKFNQSFVDNIYMVKINSSSSNGTRVLAFFNEINHSIYMDESLKLNVYAYEVILAHEIAHAAFHFLSYDSNGINTLNDFDNGMPSKTNEALADLYSYALTKGKYEKILLKDYDRDESILAKQFLHLDDTACLVKSFSNITVDMEEFSDVINMNCNTTININKLLFINN